MKRLVLVLIALVFLFGCISVANADDEILSLIPENIFLIKGEFQKYIPFGFTVPSGPCNNLEVWEWIPSYYPSSDPSAWEKKNPGERVEKGWYRFINKTDSCYARVDLSGEADINSISYWAMEVEPEEIGLFVKGKWGENNFFRLSEDDRKFSYDLIAVPIGSTTEMGEFFSGDIYYTVGKPVGFILSDSRGFLKKKVMKNQISKKQWKSEMKDNMVRDGDILVIIYQNQY